MADFKQWSQEEITRMRQEMDNMFDALCSDFDLPVMACRMTGDLNLEERGDSLNIKMEMGNINPDDIGVSVFEQQLIITVKSVNSTGHTESIETFRKIIKLPCIIRTNEVEATFMGGELNVRLPKCPTQSGLIVKVARK